MIKNKRILITGGTGSLGRELVRILRRADNHIVVYSRNEERQYLMKQDYSSENVHFFIGDVRDTDTLAYALHGCDIAIHAAAMKDLIMCEDQPTQTVLNNIDGSRSFIQAVRHTPSVTRACAVSTDKAASPSNVYGCTKYIMEQLFREANATSSCVFFSVRFGNMIDSSGALITHWKAHPELDIKLTHQDVARFFFRVEDGAKTVIKAIEIAEGGEILIRKMKKARIYDILRIIQGKDRFEIMGLFPGEKIHEELMSASESAYSYDIGDYYVIRPGHINLEPPGQLSTETAEAFTEEELRELIY
jgi:UDP-N-acetylglucosamine 4,6-dehydratase